MTDAELAFERRLGGVLAAIAYPGLTIDASRKGGSFYLQVVCRQARCNVTGAPMAWKGRKWLLSVHMTRTEIVWTAFKAILTALEHEARERFTYRGVAIADSHSDVDAMVDMVQAAGIDARDG